MSMFESVGRRACMLTALAGTWPFPKAAHYAADQRSDNRCNLHRHKKLPGWHPEKRYYRHHFEDWNAPFTDPGRRMKPLVSPRGITAGHTCEGANRSRCPVGTAAAVLYSADVARLFRISN